MLSAWYRKSIKADFNSNDRIAIGASPFLREISVGRFWRQNPMDRMLDILLVTFLACCCLTLIIGFPLRVYESLSTGLLERMLAFENAYAIVGSLLFPVSWLFCAYLFGIYAGFLRYVARHKR